MREGEGELRTHSRSSFSRCVPLARRGLRDSPDFHSVQTQLRMLRWEGGGGC